MPSTSPNRGFTVPTNLGDAGVWGQELINTLNGLDTMLGGQVTLNASQNGVSSWVLSSAQAQNAEITLGGSMPAGYTVQFSSTSYGLGSFLISNTSSGASAILVSTASSSVNTVTVPSGQSQRIFSWGNAITSETDGGSF